jgi:glutamate dehydrogenase
VSDNDVVDVTDERASTGPIERVVAAVTTAAPDRSDLVTPFVRAALRRVPATQLAQVDVDVATASLLDAFAFLEAALDNAGQTIRVVHPDIGLDGRSDAGTVIEVVGEDRPFLLATITRTIQDTGAGIVRSLHPILGIERGTGGALTALVPARTAPDRISFVHVELDLRLGAAEEEELVARLRDGLADVMRATDDHHAMRAQVQAVAERLRTDPPPTADPEEAAEAAALLGWLLDDNFILLGWREYAVDWPTDGTPATVTADPGTSLGILRNLESSRYEHPVPVTDIPEEQRRRLLQGPLLRVSRSNRRSTVHRLRRMEYIGVLVTDEQGRVVRESRLLGLFTSAGMAEPARSIPVLRRKLAAVLEREDVVAGSHEETVLVSLFQSIPKDELFQTDLDNLHETLVGLLEAEEQGRTRVMARVDDFTRTVSVLLALPKDDYSPAVRHGVTQLLMQRFTSTHVDVDLTLGDRLDAVARFTVHVDGPVPAVPVPALERDLQALVRPWSDRLTAQLVQDLGETDGRRLARTLGRRLPMSYRDVTPPAVARDDLVRLDLLLAADDTFGVWLQTHDDGIHVKAAARGGPLELSGFIPILESLGLRVASELPHELTGDDDHALTLHDFIVRDERGEAAEPPDPGQTAAAILAAHRGHVEIDGLNRLVRHAGLRWQDVTILRAYRRYRRQLGTAYSTEYVNEALATNPVAAARLIAYFDAKFDPDRDASESDIAAARQAVVAACDAIERLDHDRIVRGFLALIDGTLRTNAFRHDRVAPDASGHDVPYLALKFDPHRIPDVPHPIPYREIFVHSPAVEGVHLRGGPIARGGLRWSDRRDDFRTEVLGLMKAQVVKNALIVPTGAKGGFVLKGTSTSPEELREDVKRQYVTFIRALLDVTDNVEHGAVVPPERVRRHDGDDPYLVVAADKGTATFSDVANGVAAARGFWLDDAFASGGSQGYDHKRLGITARGAWVAIARHFRELGVDIQTDPVTVVGIGDMSGDVFGNGMLLSRSLRLVAAFDHRDIFLDPDPDPEVAYEERARLFALPRSSWQDYDRSAISAGGGVWSRDEKRIALTDEIRHGLRLDDEVLSPPELIQAILKAPVDLLYAGGIGTYIKASTETNDEVGDRANDELRIDASDLRARVVGEGANLAITQRGRIQYARRGGRVDQDAVHNAAGVDISDHEVNLKILLAVAEETGELDRPGRNRLLAEVTSDVVGHVLDDVDRQTWQLSQQAARSAAGIDEYRATIGTLETLGFLSREVDVLPSDEELAERAAAGAGLTRPELATILAAAKRALIQDIERSALPDDPIVGAAIRSYFPRTLVADLGHLLPRHRLRRELVGTIVGNDLVNGLGPTFTFQLAAETGRGVADVVAAYWVAREVADVSHWWYAVDDLTGIVTAERQLELKAAIDDLVTTLTRAYLDDRALPAVAQIVDRDRHTFEVLLQRLPQLGSETQRRQRRSVAQRLEDDLVHPALADVVAGAAVLALAPDVAALARGLGAADDVDTIAAITDAMLRLGSELGLDRLAAALVQATAVGPWQTRQRTGLASDLRRLRRDAAAVAIEVTGNVDGAVDRLLGTAGPRLAHARETLARIEGTDDVPLDAIAVATRAIIDAVLQAT